MSGKAALIPYTYRMLIVRLCRRFDERDRFLEERERNEEFYRNASHGRTISTDADPTIVVQGEAMTATFCLVSRVNRAH